jgi:serine/threonine protein kinase
MFGAKMGWPLLKLVAVLFAGSILLGVILLAFHRLRRSFVTGVVFTGPIQRPNKNPPKMGDYTLLSMVGQGGMGTVYKAVDSGGRTVAIKLIGGTGLATKARITGRHRIGLVREARLASELRHRNIVKVYDIGQHRGNLYVVMEYLQGVPLDRPLSHHRLDVSDALRIVADVCDALHYAHSLGIVHRDIKPANIFITADGTAKVLDFGLAFHKDMTKGPAALAGTVPYMSPEQVLCEDVDSRSDIWSAAVTLFEIVTGKPPFTGENFLVLRDRIVAGALPKWSSSDATSRALEKILEKALAKNRSERYQSADQFAADVRSLLHKIQTVLVNESDLAPEPVLANLSPAKPPAASEQFTTPPSSTPNLGFGEQYRTQVFLMAPSTKTSFGGTVLRCVSWGCVALSVTSLAVFGGKTIIGGVAGGTIGIALVDGSTDPVVGLVLVFGGLAALILVWIHLVLVPHLSKILFPTEAQRCRTCRSAMRSASVWERYVWSIDKTGFCAADCRAALAEGLWEDAVKLFLAHTTPEHTDVLYRLEFLECRSCRDQRAYFWFSLWRGDLWTDAWIEAYKFRDPQKANEFASVQQPSAELVTAPAPDNRPQCKGDMTV